MALNVPPIEVAFPNGNKARATSTQIDFRTPFPQELRKAENKSAAPAPAKAEKPAAPKKSAKNAGKNGEKPNVTGDEAGEDVEQTAGEKPAKTDEKDKTDETTSAETEPVAEGEEVTTAPEEEADVDTSAAALAMVVAPQVATTPEAIEDVGEAADGAALLQLKPEKEQSTTVRSAVAADIVDEDADAPADGEAPDGDALDSQAEAALAKATAALGRRGKVAADTEQPAETVPTEVAIKPHAKTTPEPIATDAATAAMAAEAAVGATTVDATKPIAGVHDSVDAPDNAIAAVMDQSGKVAAPVDTPQPVVAAPPPEVRFSETNHASIVSAMKAELMPNGGTMRMRLDPPQLGALQVTVQMRDGVMTASFETSNDEATKLLSHSLSTLKTALESQGVTVDKIQVQQAPREAQANRGDDGQQQQRDGHQDQSARQEQQRKEMVRRMWRRLSGQADPLDVTG